MLSIKSRIPKKKNSSMLVPVLPLLPKSLLKLEDDKSQFILIDLKNQVGQPANRSTYKKYIQKFNKGSPQQWIDVLKDMQEVWTQNSINGGADRAWQRYVPL